MPDKSKYKTFKEYYADPEFRERHLRYMSTKVPCECGIVTRRSYMSRHRRTIKHQKRMEEKEKEKSSDSE